MYKTPIQGYQLLGDLSLHNLEWTCEEEIKGDVCSAKHNSQNEVALLLKHQKHLERQIEILTTSLHALEAKQGVTTESYLAKPMISKQEFHSSNLGGRFPRSSLESILETFMMGQARLIMM